jgi:hypothetical protein
MDHMSNGPAVAARTVNVKLLAERLYLRSKVPFFMIRHPHEITRLPRWFRERNGSTMTMRSPWWPYSGIEWMASALPRHARVFEYGGGGSTLWLEDRDAMVTVVEHDKEWYGQLAEILGSGTRLLFQPPASTGSITSVAAAGHFDDYVVAIDGERDGSLDLVIVDGRARVECVGRAMAKVKPGGLLLLDDTDRARYRPAVELLRGWERHVFAGLKAGQHHPAQTSVWRRTS